MSDLPVRRRRWWLLGLAVPALAGLGCWLAVQVGRLQDTADRMSCNLGSVHLALHNYHDIHGGLPPAVLYGQDGSPLLSWRVLILPYLEEDALYREFHLDEPWDSPHNIQLLPRMPRTYAHPTRKTAQLPPHHTVLHVFVGPGTAFEEGPRTGVARDGTLPVGLKIPDDFSDGAEDTLLFVEAGEPAPWTKPQELPYDPDGPLPALPGLFRDGFRAMTVGGSGYLFVRPGTSEATLRAAITRNGGEAIDVSGLR